MNIIIAIKQVPETSRVRMDPETGTMIREGVESIINPLDLYAIEVGIRLAEAHGGKTTVLSMGPAKAEEALREAIAMGCDDGVLLSHRAFAGSDTWATSYALSLAIRKLGAYDLILCGERATDGDTGQVGPGIAAWLDIPVATYVSRVLGVAQPTQSVSLSNRPSAVTGRCTGGGACATPSITACAAPSITVKRLVEDGYETLEVETPCLLTVVKEAADPRMPTLRGKQRARKIEIPVWGPDEIGADAQSLGLKGSPTRVVKIESPRVARDGDIRNPKDPAELESAVDGIVAYLEKLDLL